MQGHKSKEKFIVKIDRVDELSGNQMSHRIYPPPIDQFLTLGMPTSEFLNYRSMGITEEHISESIRMLEEMQEERFSIPEQGDEDDDSFWSPIHAWRALGQLGAEEAIHALLRQLHHIDDNDDEWLLEEVDEVFAQIGPASIEPLGFYLSSSENSLYARIAAGESLVKLGINFPDFRGRCITIISTVLESYADQDEILNASIVYGLMQLNDLNSVSLVEKAFQADKVDEILFGDFEDYQVRLGLIPKRATPKRNEILRSLYLSKQAGFDASKKEKSKDRKEKNKHKQEKKSRRKNRRK
jgi:hypothetical protein